MNKMKNVIFFASVCTVSFCLVLVFDASKRKNSRKKIEREIHEVFEKINETSVFLIKGDNGSNDSGRFITKK